MNKNLSKTGAEAPPGTLVIANGQTRFNNVHWYLYLGDDSWLHVGSERFQRCSIVHHDSRWWTPDRYISNTGGFDIVVLPDGSSKT